MRRVKLDEEQTMLIGPPRDGPLLEIGQAVHAAREHGRSWNQLATALGVSRQAARQRFNDRVNNEQRIP